MGDGTVSEDGGTVTTTVSESDTKKKPKSPVSAILESGRQDIPSQDEKTSSRGGHLPLSIVLK